MIRIAKILLNLLKSNYKIINNSLELKSKLHNIIAFHDAKHSDEINKLSKDIDFLFANRIYDTMELDFKMRERDALEENKEFMRFIYIKDIAHKVNTCIPKDESLYKKYTDEDENGDEYCIEYLNSTAQEKLIKDIDNVLSDRIRPLYSTLITTCSILSAAAAIGACVRS